MSRVAEWVGRFHTPAGRWILSEVDSNVGDALPGLRDATQEYLDRHRPALRESILGGAGGIDAAQEHSKVMDGLLTSLFCAAHTTAGFPLDGATNRVALVGVGGIGRGLVGVHSDIDLLFLCDDPLGEAGRENHQQQSNNMKSFGSEKSSGNMTTFVKKF